MRNESVSLSLTRSGIAYLIAPPATGQWLVSNNNMWNTNTGNVGIGASFPQVPLTVGYKRAVFGGLSLLGSYNPPTEGFVAEYQSPQNVFLQTWGAVNGANATGLLFIVAPQFNYSGILQNRIGTGVYLPFVISVGGAERFRISTAGYVGIGTSPTVPFDVAGNSRITGDLTVTGNIAAKYQDVAEWVSARENAAAGTVVVLDTSCENTVARSRKAYDTAVAGVVSDTPALLLGEPGTGRVKVATTGRVRVRAEASRRPVAIGDLLVTSEQEGTVMASEPINVGGVSMHRPGTIVGKALEQLTTGTGEILVLLSLQ